MNILHSSKNDSWGTPPHIIELVRQTLGPIGFDPASSEHANATVQASTFFTKEVDALTTPWPMDPGMSVYLNPPGGKRRGRSMAGLFWERLLAHRAGFSHAIFAMYSISGLQITQNYGPLSALDFPLCVPKTRVRWVHQEEHKTSPSHANAFVYVPGRVDETDRFKSVFDSLGACAIPRS